MVAMFEDEWGEARGLDRVRLVLRTTRDLLATATFLRWDEYRAMGGFGGVSGLSEDLAWVKRGLLRRPGFSAVIVLTLTLGIGVNVAIFSFVNGLLLKPLPYGEPERLLQLSETFPGLGTMDLSLPDFHRWRSDTRVFEGMFAFDDQRFVLSGPGRADFIEGAVVSPGFLGVLDVPVTIGRDFLPVEELPGSDQVAIISRRLWTTRFGGRSEILGEVVRIDGRERVVVGVAPQGFNFPEVADLWVPLSFSPSGADPEDYGFDAIARLDPAFSLSDALEEGERISATLAEEFPGTKTGIGTTVYPLRYADVPGGLAIASFVLMATTSLIMLIACANVSMMLLARGEERREEMEIRSALGASRGRLARQLLVESGVLAGIGLTGAVALAVAACRVFPLLLPPGLPFWLHFGLDGRVLGWSLLAGLASSLAVGLLPALRVSRAEGELGVGSGTRVIPGQGRFIVGSQVAMASLLVVVAGLSVRALSDLRAMDPGLDSDGRLVLGVSLPTWDYPDGKERMALVNRIIDQLSGLPGVRSVGVGGTLPYFGSGDEVAVQAGSSSQGRSVVAVIGAIGGDYFSALGIPIVRGRSPSSVELREGAAVTVLSQGMAEKLWPGEDPIGRRIRHSPPGAKNPFVAPDQPALEVIGVAGDVHHEGPGRSPREQVYLPLGPGAPAILGLVIHFGGASAVRSSLVRDRVTEVDPGIVLFNQMELGAALDLVLWGERQTSVLLAGFAILALALALSGVFGVVAYKTRRREREMCVRVALGASRRSIRRNVLAGTLLLVLPGLTVGFAGALGIATSARAALPWIPVWDPITLLGTGALFLFVALLAGSLPAQRATRIDPLKGLR
jgi:predicted permease